MTHWLASYHKKTQRAYVDLLRYGERIIDLDSEIADPTPEEEKKVERALKLNVPTRGPVVFIKKAARIS